MEWLLLVNQFLMPMLLKCFGQISSETPQEYLRRSYDPVTGKLEQDIVLDAIPTTARAVRKAWRHTPRHERGNKPRYSREALYDLTEVKLIEAMNATPEQVAACAEVVAKMGVDD